MLHMVSLETANIASWQPISRGRKQGIPFQSILSEGRRKWQEYTDTPTMISSHFQSSCLLKPTSPSEALKEADMDCEGLP